MGKMFSSRQMETNQPAMTGVGNLESWGQQQGLGKAGKSAKNVLGQMASGDYSNLAGTLLSPIHDQYATQGREMERSMLMGGNALGLGSNQPALMAGLQNESRARMAEGEGLAYGQAIPQLWGQAGQQYQGALNSQRGAQESALQGGIQGRLAANQYVTKPGWFDRLGQVVGTVGQIGGMAMGMAGLGGAGGGSLPGVSGPTSSNISNYANMVPRRGP